MRTTLAQLQLAANSYVAPREARCHTREGRRRSVGARTGGRSRQRQPAAVRHRVRDRGLDARPLGEGEVVARRRDEPRGSRGRHRSVVAAAHLARRRRRRRRCGDRRGARGRQHGEGRRVRRAGEGIDPDRFERSARRGTRSSRPTTSRTRSSVPRRSGSSIPRPSPSSGEFVERYFDMLLPIWDSRSYQIAQYIIVGLLPRAAGEPRTARRDSRVARRESGRRACAAPPRRREPRRRRACARRAGARRAVARLDRMPRPAALGGRADAQSDDSGGSPTRIGTMNSVLLDTADRACSVRSGSRSLAAAADIGWHHSRRLRHHHRRAPAQLGPQARHPARRRVGSSTARRTRRTSTTRRRWIGRRSLRCGSFSARGRSGRSCRTSST